MASSKIFRVFSSLFIGFIGFLILTVNSQSTGFSASNGADKGDHANGHFLPEESCPGLVERPTISNCAVVENSLYDGQGQRDGKQGKFSYGDSTNPRFYDYRYYLPVGSLRSKKAQKAILLDVGDYVIKGNGGSMVESTAGRSPNMMGGILRSSGK